MWTAQCCVVHACLNHQFIYVHAYLLPPHITINMRGCSSHTPSRSSIISIRSSGRIDASPHSSKTYLVEIAIEKRVEVVVHGGDRADGTGAAGDVCGIVDIHSAVPSRGGHMVCLGRPSEGADGVLGPWRESNIGIQGSDVWFWGGHCVDNEVVDVCRVGVVECWMNVAGWLILGEGWWKVIIIDRVCASKSQKGAGFH